MTLAFKDEKYFKEDEEKFLDCVHLISNDLHRICNQYDEAFNEYQGHFMPQDKQDLVMIQQLLHLVRDTIDNKYHIIF
jgi:hypothetical protein